MVANVLFVLFPIFRTMFPILKIPIPFETIRSHTSFRPTTVVFDSVRDSADFITENVFPEHVLFMPSRYFRKTGFCFSIFEAKSPFIDTSRSGLSRMPFDPRTICRFPPIDDFKIRKKHILDIRIDIEFRIALKLLHNLHPFFATVNHARPHRLQFSVYRYLGNVSVNSERIRKSTAHHAEIQIHVSRHSNLRSRQTNGIVPIVVAECSFSENAFLRNPVKDIHVSTKYE